MEERHRREAGCEDDVYGWSQRQAALLCEGRYDDADMDNVAEEIDSLGRPQVASLEACYRLIPAHLLEVLVQSERFTRSWQVTIVRERLNAQSCFDVSPSLKPRRAALFDQSYRQVRRLASAETGLPMQAFPDAPPFTLEELSSEEYNPLGDAGRSRGARRPAPGA